MQCPAEAKMDFFNFSTNNEFAIFLVIKFWLWRHAPQNVAKWDGWVLCCKIKIKIKEIDGCCVYLRDKVHGPSVFFTGQAIPSIICQSMFAPHWQFNPQNHTTSRPWQPSFSWSRLKAFVRAWVKEYFAGSRLIGLSGMAADKRESSHWLMMRGQSGSPDNQLKRIQCTYANTQKIMFSY